MLELTAKRVLSPAAAAALKGTFLGNSSFDTLLPEDQAVKVYREDGSLLCSYLPGVLPAEACAAAWPALRRVSFSPPTNRGTAAGIKTEYNLLRDGTRSKTRQLRPSRNSEVWGVGSSVVGAMDRGGGGSRYPVCRLTAFNIDRPDLFAQAVPFFQAVDGVFREHVPDRWGAQMACVQATHPAWVIHGTAFTTVTVNKSFRTAVHQDKGDLAEGFGVMAALRAGEFSGCLFVLPAYRIAVDMRTGGVLLADVHEWHGNTELVGRPGAFERISCVLYYRAKMHRCGSPEEEIEVGKRRKAGDPIWPEAKT